MSDPERDEFDIWLETWGPSERLAHATLDSNLDDPLAEARLIADSTGEAPLKRAGFISGTKLMTEEEPSLRRFEFFKKHQSEWSAHFQDLVLSKGVAPEKLDAFRLSFATDWVDGRSRRQASPTMLAIKASIQLHDEDRHPISFGRYVVNQVSTEVAPLFTPAEMAAIFAANSGLLEAFVPDYLTELYGPHGSINRLYVRRGVCMPHTPGPLRKELHYLSSYSLALTPVEQFAQTYTDDTKEDGVRSIFSAPLPAVQNRIVAFAPFIEGMDIRQLELVVAPPVEKSELFYCGEYGGIHDYEFE